MKNLRKILADEGLVVREAAIAPMLVRTLLTRDGWNDIVWKGTNGRFITNGGEYYKRGKPYGAWKLGDVNEAEEILKGLDARGLTPEGKKYVWEMRVFRTFKEAVEWVGGSGRRLAARKVRLKKVRDLWDLRAKAAKDPHYLRLMEVAAENLGYSGSGGINEWNRWLEMNAMETSSEGYGDGSSMVTDEVNFVLDIVQDEINKGKLAREAAGNWKLALPRQPWGVYDTVAKHFNPYIWKTSHGEYQINFWNGDISVAYWPHGVPKMKGHTSLGKKSWARRTPSADPQVQRMRQKYMDIAEAHDAQMRTPA